MNSLKLLIIRFWPLIFFLVVISFFFRPFIFESKLPTPSDTIVGMYHPFRDVTWGNLTAGVPFKNFLITDPVRQQYPWRELTIDSMKNGQWSLWNPYSFAGTPLLANLQSAAFYPLNFLFFLLPFNFTWSFLIFLEPLLAGIFLYLYLRNLNLEKWSSLLGAISFAFSGFFIAWLEWGTVLHSALWLPLILLSIDKIFPFFKTSQNEKLKMKNEKRQRRDLRSLLPQCGIKIKNLMIWSAIFVFSLASSFFAGHLQTFFYVAIVSVIYVIARWLQYGRDIKVVPLFIIHYSLFIILTAVQWIPTIQFINLSGRGLDQLDWQREGWFIPWQNLIQFLAPDFFGNPATLNYWGAWNYAEFAGYIGVVPLFFALWAMIWRFDKKTLFFGSLLFLSLSFALPTPWAKIPYQLQLPFLSTAQPTRLLFLADFSLAVLAALGWDWFMKRLNGPPLKNLILIVFLLGGILVGLWVFVLNGPTWLKDVSWENLQVAKRNLILPSGLFVLLLILLFSFIWVSKMFKGKLFRSILVAGILILTVFDLLRFGQKFTPFAKREWLFPQTKTIEFLKSQEKPFRIMATDRRIFPPNFPVAYRLESIEGYDPLYLSRYAELIAASERGKPDISPPFGFNRIITPHNFDSRIIDLLNVKYVLSLEDLKSKKLKQVFQEGETRVYENKEFFPRAFLVHDIKIAQSKQEAIDSFFEKNIDLKTTVIAEEPIEIKSNSGKNQDEVKIVKYEEQKIIIETKSESEAMLVVSQNFYPIWQALIDGKDAKIYRVNYALSGVVVPQGVHEIRFYTSL